MVRILFIGDIMGKPGRRAVRELLPTLRMEYGLDFIIANVENSAGGAGLTQKIYKELDSYGIDAMTGGNHIWDKREIFKHIDEFKKLVRPINYPQGVPGSGYRIFISDNGVRLAVISAMGRIFMQCLENPFRVLDETIKKLDTKLIIVDFHAEATSEKQAMGYFLDGRVSAVLGTHTHVQTADERILDNGTAYITDVGMTGGLNGVIGVKKGIMIDRFIRGISDRMEPSKSGIALQGVFIEIDDSTGKAVEIKRITEPLKT